MESISTAPVPEIFSIEQNGEKFAYVVRPSGWTGEFVRDSRFDITPKVVCGERSFADTKSFSLYFERFCDERSLVTASREGLKVIAELDYHLDPATPQPGKHCAVRNFDRDRRYAAWKDRSGMGMSQASFVEFIEDRLKDVIEPNQAELLQSIVQFKAFRTANCASFANRANGDVAFQYTQVTTKGANSGEAVMPELIKIRVPVLEFEAEWDVAVRLRFRLNEGALNFSFDLVGVKDLEDEAFKVAVEQLSKDIGQDVLLVD